MSARRRRHEPGVAGVALALALLWPAGATANPALGGASFATARELPGATVELVNAALYRYLFFDVYAAALYLAPGTDPRVALADDVARRLEVVYLRDIGADDLARAAVAVLERNLDTASFAALAPDIERLHGWYRDVREGDRIALDWVPGRGTTLELNGARLGTVEGAAFARAYFAIWLGEAPIDEELRAALLAPQASDRATPR